MGIQPSAATLTAVQAFIQPAALNANPKTRIAHLRVVMGATAASSL
jgi:hypothetical protein